MSYLVLDLETSMSHGGYGRDSNPFFDKILCYGIKTSYMFGYSIECEEKDYIPPSSCYFWNPALKTIVGHNIKFDLLFLWRNNEIQDYFKRGGRVFDTQLTEYIISGQRYKYPALRDIAVNNYGCKERIKHIEGKKTDDVDIQLLLEDVKNDVLDTEQVMLKQVQILKKEGMFNLAISQMESVLATTEMEFNGLYINKDILRKNCADLQQQLTQFQQDVDNIVKNHWVEDLIFNMGSSQQLAKLFFGGTVAVKRKRPVLDELGHPIKIKSGKNIGTIKVKNVEEIIQVKGLGLKPHKDWLTPTGKISTGDKILAEIAKRDDPAGVVAKAMLEVRYLDKQINTYYIGFRDLIYPFDGCIHGQFSHCGYDTDGDIRGGTTTGRLSSNKPNLQNLPRSNGSKVKDHFTSRWKDEGCMVEFDFKQMEIVAFAFLSQDPTLMNDIKSGKDIHAIMVKELFGVQKGEVEDKYFDNLRTRVKPGTFLLIYGGSAQKLSREHNLDLEFCKKFVRVFWDRYPTAKQWQENNVAKVKESAILIDEYTPKGYQKYEGMLQNVSGRKLYFKTTDSPQWLIDTTGQATGFNPPDIKDYPVQSFATADIVLMTLGILWRKAIHHRDKFLMVNTVHDSVLLDCKKESLDLCCDLIQDSIYLIKDEIKKVFKLDFNLPISVDIKVGESWGNMKEYKPNLERIKE